MRLTMGLKTLLIVLPCFPHCIFVRSSPLHVTPLQIIGVNNTTPSTVSLTAPTPPRSIRLIIDHDLNKKLLALGIYLTAIQVMIICGQEDWDIKPIGPNCYRQWARGPGVWQKGYDVEIDIKNSQVPGDPLQLKTSYIITGLWETMVQVAEANLYYETTLTLKQHYREIGTVKIKELTLGATGNSTIENENLLSMPVLPGNADSALLQTNPVNVTAVPSYPSGRVATRTNPQVTIMYTYSIGTQIKSKDVFMAIIGLLAEAAQYRPLTALTGMQQESPSKKCEVAIRPLVAPYPVTYRYATTGLWALISFVMLPLEKFGDMTFVLEYQGFRLAEGYIKAKFPAPGIAAGEE